jgi:hypothetical protein
MPKIFKSNAALSLGILMLGTGGLAVMIWLSPSRPQQGIQQLTPHTAPLASREIPPDLSASRTDPFAERLNTPLAAQTATTSDATNPAAGQQVPVGVDPFKEKLIQQSKLSATSPFGVQR